MFRQLAIVAPPLKPLKSMRNSFFVLCAWFGLGGKHVASPIPLQGKLESAATLTPEPEGLPSGSFSLPPSIGEQGGGRKGYAVDRVKVKEKNQTGQDGRRTEENQWTWPKMQWRDGRGEGRKGNVNTLFGEGQTPTIRIKDLLWVEGESRIMVEASVHPPIPVLTQWTLAYTQVSCLGKLLFFNGRSIS